MRSIGAMRSLLTLMRRADTETNDVGQPTDDWVPVGDPRWAEIAPIRGNEPWVGTHNVSMQDVKVTMHFWDDIKSTDRFRTESGEDLEILAVIKPAFDNSHLVIPCKWVQLMGDGAANADEL